MKRVLIISNGHGEDLIAATLIESLREEAPDYRIMALPIVGLGEAYQKIDIPLAMPGKTLPSGGFLRNNLRNFFMDLQGGLLGLTWRQIRTLREIRGAVDLLVCVGDVYLVLLAGWFTEGPIFFLPTAKSDHIATHWPIEIRMMKRFCEQVFPRDAKTAESLAEKGLSAMFVGNLMMDALKFQAPDLKSTEEEWTVAILPGSRREAYLNMEDLAKATLSFRRLVSKKSGEKDLRFLVALSGGLSIAEISARLAPDGWKETPPSSEEAKMGIIGHLDKPVNGQRLRMTVIQGRFADILAASDIVIGLAGTASEQAVGLGKPVIAFPGRGPQFTERFAAAQKRLLGEAISLVARDPEVVAEELWAILTDESRRKRMAAVGRERMGEPGGARAIAIQIKEFLGSPLP